MKVYEASGYNYKRSPSIILKGDWLKETRFDVGGLIQVECENGKLIIIPREPEMVEYHAPCGQCMMVAEDCKCYGKDYCIRCHEGRSRQVRLHLQFGIFIEEIKTIEISIGNLMMNQMDEEEQPNPVEYIINRNGVDFIPSSKVLSAVDAKLRLEMGAEKILACILEPLRANYDYILIDTCPSLNTLNINALSAADEVIIVADTQFWAMTGLEDFLLTVKKIKKRVNSKLDVSRILLTMCEENQSL